MARRPGGQEHLRAAQALLWRARTADELRTAQAVLLPIVLGLSIEQTAQAIGRSAGATCTIRTRFCRVAAGEQALPRTKSELRNRALVSLESEARLIARVCGSARQANAAMIPRLKVALEAEVGRAVAWSSVYRLLQRHGWARVEQSAQSLSNLPRGVAERRSKSKPRWVKA